MKRQPDFSLRCYEGIRIIVFKPTPAHHHIKPQQPQIIFGKASPRKAYAEITSETYLCSQKIIVRCGGHV